MKTTRTLLLALLLFTGCAMKDYEVKLVDPQGYVHETYTVENMVHHPRLKHHFGGQTSIRGYKHIEAPTGWRLDIDEVE